jgi:hypothetical protein
MQVPSFVGCLRKVVADLAEQWDIANSAATKGSGNVLQRDEANPTLGLEEQMPTLSSMI